jgi:hypothetical protein
MRPPASLFDFEDRLYLAAGSFLSASALDFFLVLVAEGGDR